MNIEYLIKGLFETKALVVCNEKEPFWYTSGTIGPYYINTHFLYGSKIKAENLLSYIDNQKDDINIFHDNLLKETHNNYKNDEIYKNVIDSIIMYIKKNLDLNSIDIISGGERRDWFFSNIIAHLLEKPHLTIYKNKKVQLFRKDEILDLEEVKGKNILHIADLVTEASSYIEMWIPMINEIGGSIKNSLVVIDRNQGAKEILNNENIKLHSMIKIDIDFFQKANDLRYINKEQLILLSAYILEPKKSMKEFLKENKQFLIDSLNSDQKTIMRAKKCIDNKIYGDI